MQRKNIYERIGEAMASSEKMLVIAYTDDEESILKQSGFTKLGIVPVPNGNSVATNSVYYFVKATKYSSWDAIVEETKSQKRKYANYGDEQNYRLLNK